MIISKNSWHWKLYVFVEKALDAFKGDSYYNYDYNSYKTIGLCEYMRTLLMWGPLLLLFYIFTVFCAVVAFVFIPIATGGASLAPIIFIIVLGFIAYGLFKLIYYIIDRRMYENLGKPKQPNLIIEYGKALKNQICPILEVKE